MFLVTILLVAMAYHPVTLRGLAVAHMVFGSLMIILGIASVIAVDHWCPKIGYGVWLGIWILLTGLFGFIGAKDDLTPNKCLIGTYMGFAITACVLTFCMFITYCIALANYSEIRNCKTYHLGSYNTFSYKTYCNSASKRHMAAVGLGLGSCLLICAIVEFILALTSSIYCCGAVCCNTPSAVAVTNQQVTYIQPGQPAYTGPQGGMVIFQPTGAVTTATQAYPVVAQPQVYVQQQVHPGVTIQQPAYWAVPPGSNPAGTVTVTQTGAVSPQIQTQVQSQTTVTNERPPLYAAYMQTSNPPP